jgi:hypothetical protein
MLGEEGAREFTAAAKRSGSACLCVTVPAESLTEHRNSTEHLHLERSTSPKRRLRCFERPLRRWPCRPNPPCPPCECVVGPELRMACQSIVTDRAGRQMKACQVRTGSSHAPATFRHAVSKLVWGAAMVVGRCRYGHTPFGRLPVPDSASCCAGLEWSARGRETSFMGMAPGGDMLRHPVSPSPNWRGGGGGGGARQFLIVTPQPGSLEPRPGQFREGARGTGEGEGAGRLRGKGTGRGRGSGRGRLSVTPRAWTPVTSAPVRDTGWPRAT